MIQAEISEKVVVAFTTFNPRSGLRGSVLQAALESKRVLIVDDGTDNEFAGFVNVHWMSPNVRLIKKQCNAGIADSVNIALAYAIEVEAEYLMLFDQDTVVRPGLITAAVRSADNLREGCETLGCLGAGVIHGREYRTNHHSVVAPVPEVIQSGSIYSVQALAAIGGARAELVIDTVDTDICLRLRLHGYGVFVDKSLSIFHPVGSGKSIELLGHSVLITDHSPLRRYYMTRNRVYLLTQRQWWRLDPRWCLIYTRRFFVSCVIAVVFEKHRLRKVRAIIFGLTDGLLGRLGQRELAGRL